MLFRHEGAGDARQTGDGAHVPPRFAVDHVEGIVGGMRDIEAPTPAVDRSMVEAAGLGVRREIDITEQLEHDEPTARLPLDRTAVRVERVVHRKLPGHVVEIVPCDRLKSCRRRVQAGRLRREGAGVRIGSS